MYDDETMVENDYADANDPQDEGIVEATDESEQDLEEYIDSESEASEEDQQEEEPEQSQGTSGPGYVQRRIDKALAKERANIKAEIQAEMEAQYAPIRERLLDMDAQELVRKGTVKDLETAKELVRYRQGMQPQAKQEQPRNEQGQFTSQQEMIETAKTEARIDELKYQAEKIKRNGGPDVIAEFSNNQDIKRRVVSGELDF